MDISDLIRICAIVGPIGIVVSLNLVVRWYKFWLLYVFASILFIIQYTHLWYVKGENTFWTVFMGTCTLIAGIRNYYIGYKKSKKDIS